MDVLGFRPRRFGLQLLCQCAGASLIELAQDEISGRNYAKVCIVANFKKLNFNLFKPVAIKVVTNTLDSPLYVTLPLRT